MSIVGHIALVIWVSFLCVALYVTGYKSGELDEHSRHADDYLKKLKRFEELIQMYREMYETKNTAFEQRLKAFDFLQHLHDVDEEDCE